MTRPRCRYLQELKLAARSFMPGVDLRRHINDQELRYAVALVARRHGIVVFGAALTRFRLLILAQDTTGEFSAFMCDLVKLLGDIARKKSKLPYVWAPGRPEETNAADPTSRDDVVELFFELHVAAFVDGTTQEFDESHIRFGLSECFARPNDQNEERPAALGRRSQRAASASFSVRKPRAFRGRRPTPIRKRITRLIRKRMPQLLARTAHNGKTIRPAYGSGGCRFVGQTSSTRELEYREWRRRYDACREKFRTDRNVVFPAGVVQFHNLGASCYARTSFLVAVARSRAGISARVTPDRTRPPRIDGRAVPQARWKGRFRPFV